MTPNDTTQNPLCDTVWLQLDFVSLRCADAAERGKLAPVGDADVQKLKVTPNITTESKLDVLVA